MFPGPARQPFSEFVVIEYPGVIKNTSKALDTLGGMEAISSAHFSNQQLKLRYQPDNVYHSGMLAEKQTLDSSFSGQMNLIIKVKKKRNDSRAKFSAICLGVADTILTFKSIYDFQYLPLSKSDKDPEIYTDLTPNIIPSDFGTALSWWDSFDRVNPTGIDNKDLALFFPPFAFSRYNTPSRYLLRNAPESTSTRSVVGLAKNLRSERKSYTVLVSGNDPFPEKPSEAAIRDVEMRCKDERQHKRLIELFNERPLWTRIALMSRSGISHNTLKIINAKYAFYISTGPWARLWCRFGYDPRKDPLAKQYQTVVVCFRRKRFIPEKPRIKAVKAKSISSDIKLPAETDPHEYIYRSGHIPSMRQMWYCICDINLPIAQKIIRKDFIVKECNRESGWMPQEKIKLVREAVRNDVKETARKMACYEDYDFDDSIDQESDSE